MAGKVIIKILKELAIPVILEVIDITGKVIIEKSKKTV